LEVLSRPSRQENAELRRWLDEARAVEKLPDGHADRFAAG
jgi:hypothetical protein